MVLPVSAPVTVRLEVVVAVIIVPPEGGVGSPGFAETPPVSVVVAIGVVLVADTLAFATIFWCTTYAPAMAATTAKAITMASPMPIKPLDAMRLFIGGKTG